MKFLFASDSFKGSLSSEKIVEILTESAKCIFPDCQCRGVSVADGGEGTVEAVVHAMGGSLRCVSVHGPLMEETTATYGVFQNSHAVIEMAAASGLPMVPAEKRNPLHTTTYGTGELIKDALDQGYRNISIAIGGSATNDGGMGAMSALGVRFLDKEGNVLTGFGEDLGKVHSIDGKGLHPAAAETEFTVMCDVTNPLTGLNGATYTFGKQKGGTPEILERLEKDMEAYAGKLLDLTGIDVNQIPGSGAAGGLGAALKVFLHANMKSGIETVLDLIEFDSLLEGVDLVITGEGRMDWQSAFGKVPSGIGMRCKAKGIPALAIVGGLGEGAEKIYEFGIESIMTTIQGAMSVEEAIERAEELYRSAADRTFHMLRTGRKLNP
ncbi:glycerate kinase family protein [Lacrimispora indolis]|uniref:glycerate kinase family protein n=1 Tax=Lacrimispora indolis TaxID=69825 RepID=UPI00045EC598|nr:glycerate kinase [Lacrimispora indolis]MBE7722847.1 glycerate kinase [Lacrimispora celerecrescens]